MKTKEELELQFHEEVSKGSVERSAELKFEATYDNQVQYPPNDDGCDC